LIRYRFAAAAGSSLLLLCVCASETDVDTSRPASLQTDRATLPPLIEEGRVAYGTYCVGCHGEAGDGRGEAARFLHPKPRDFQKANFKFSSTRSGRLPTDDDLRRTIVEGLRGSAMPGWSLLPDRTVTALIAYIKTFSQKWIDAEVAAAIPFVEDPYRARTDKSAAIERGRAMYHGYATCWTCHPTYESTDRINDYLQAMDNPTRDAWRSNLFQAEAKPNAEGEIIFPPDFKRDFVRAGTDLEDLYRSIAAGITGTAMPTWVDSIAYTKPDGAVLTQRSDLWALAYYVQDLIKQRPPKLAPAAFAVRDRPEPIGFPSATPAQQPVTTEEFFEE